MPPALTRYPRRSTVVGFSASRCRIVTALLVCTVSLSAWFLLWAGASVEQVEEERQPDPLPTADPPPPPSPSPEPPVPPSGLHSAPPLYSEYHWAELALPQHKWNVGVPASEEKFFYAAGHASQDQGWGNSLQEFLMHAYLTYKSGRIFVFDNYTWNDNPNMPYTHYKGRSWIPSQIPWSVAMRGPLVGDPFPPGQNPLPAVNRVYFNHICPTKTTLYFGDVYGEDGVPPTAGEIVEAWARKLREVDDPCVQSWNYEGIFTHGSVFGKRGALEDVWQDFSTSPIITHFRWSPLIEIGFDANRDLFLSSEAQIRKPFLSTIPFTTNADRYTPIAGLMVIHLRRGDYSYHCDSLAHGLEDYVSVASFSSMVDQFVVPTDEIKGETSPANVQYYKQHCYPTIEQITTRVADVLATPAARGIRKLFIMSNGESEWIHDLEDALREVADWDMISSSRDVTVSWEQKYVAQCIDSLVAQRAQVFIGNGFSTLTTTVATMRLANGFPLNSTRFW
ncbi:hypothetical protein C8Q78DRAFT_964081 [Trametes maxima]|nr:hypothetical protein C8Q78DRAFT_964081 [Trametes maxima]